MYIANFGSNTVSVISSLTNTVVATIPVGSNPLTAVYAPANRDLYVMNRFSTFVSVIDSSTNTVIINIPVGQGPSWATYNPSDNTLFVNDEDVSTVSVIDTSTQSVVANVPVGPNPHVSTYDFTNGEIYVTNVGSNTVSAISQSTPPPPPPCREADGNGDFHGSNGKGNFHADDDHCEDGNPNKVSSSNVGDGKDFESTSISTASFDDLADTVTITGLGTHGGIPVAFTFMAMETGPTTPGWVSFNFSDGYSNAGTLTSGTILLH